MRGCLHDKFACEQVTSVTWFIQIVDLVCVECVIQCSMRTSNRIFSTLYSTGSSFHHPLYSNFSTAKQFFVCINYWQCCFFFSSLNARFNRPILLFIFNGKTHTQTRGHSTIHTSIARKKYILNAYASIFFASNSSQKCFSRSIAVNLILEFSTGRCTILTNNSENSIAVVLVEKSNSEHSTIGTISLVVFVSWSRSSLERNLLINTQSLNVGSFHNVVIQRASTAWSIPTSTHLFCIRKSNQSLSRSLLLCGFFSLMYSSLRLCFFFALWCQRNAKLLIVSIFYFNLINGRRSERNQKENKTTTATVVATDASVNYALRFEMNLKTYKITM